MERIRRQIRICFDSEHPMNALRAQLMCYALALMPVFLVIPLGYMPQFVSDQIGLLCKFAHATLLFYAIVLTLFFLAFAGITLFHWMMRRVEKRE